MSEALLRVAIIGTGMIGGVHRRAARDAGAHVVGVLGSTPAKSEAAALDWGIDRGYASLDDLLADRPDVVQICTPNATHHPYALAVIRAGIHVVCEKPLALTGAQGLELVRAAADAGVVATVPFAYRYHPLVRELRARRLAGEFGQINLVHGSYLQDWLLDPDSSSWRVDVGAGGTSRAFADIGSHWCDLAEFLSGERFESVSAITSIVYETRPVPSGPSFGSRGAGAGAGAGAGSAGAGLGARAGSAGAGAGSAGAGAGAAAGAGERIRVTTEDTAVATFRTASGITANTVVSQVSAGRKNRLWVEVDGSRGSAVFDQENPETVWLGTEAGASILQRGAGFQAPDQERLTRVPAGHPQGYPDAFTAFLQDTYAAVRGASPEGLPTFADGLRASRIIDAVLASAASSSWVAIDGDADVDVGAEAGAGAGAGAGARDSDSAAAAAAASAAAAPGSADDRIEGSSGPDPAGAPTGGPRDDPAGGAVGDPACVAAGVAFAESTSQSGVPSEREAS